MPTPVIRDSQICGKSVLQKQLYSAPYYWGAWFLAAFIMLINIKICNKGKIQNRLIVERII
jgi:hypothetical protein